MVEFDNYDKQMQFGKKIPEGYLITRTLEDYLKAQEQGDIFKMWYSLRSLYSLAKPYLRLYNDVGKKAGRMKESIRKKIIEYKKAYGEDKRELKEAVFEDLGQLYDILWETFGRAGLLGRPSLEIRLVPNWYAEVDEIYRKKYGIKVKDQLQKLEEDMKKAGVYKDDESVVEEIHEEEKEMISETIGEEAFDKLLEVSNLLKTNEGKKMLAKKIEEVQEEAENKVDIEEVFKD